MKGNLGCYTKNVEDEKHFLLDCLAYTHIRSHFQDSYHTTNLPNPLTQQKYGDIGKLLLMLFEQKQNSKGSKVITYPLKVQ